jgi:chemotaxis protein MotB
MQHLSRPAIFRSTNVSHSRWLLPWADFVTLLFAVFVVLFAFERSGRDGPRDLARAMLHGLHRNGPSARAAVAKPTPTADPAMPSLEQLTNVLKAEIDSGALEVKQEARGLVISLRQAAFFESGQADIHEAAYDIVDKIAAIIGPIPNAIRLEGHTDSVPISNSRFRSNWELSAVRSIRMLELFVTRNGVSRERLSIAGFAEMAPLSPNDSADGRARNRRVDVVILNQTATRSAL